MPTDHGDILHFFLSLIQEGAPFILLGALLSGLIDAYLPPRLMDRLLPTNPLGGVLMAGLLGIVFPVCECAIVPVIRRLVAKGLPVSCAMTYMLASPIVNPLTAFSTWSAFLQGGKPMALQTTAWTMMGFRLMLGYLIAVIIGGLLTRVKAHKLLQPSVLSSVEAGKVEAAKAAASDKQVPAGEKLVRAMRTAQKDFIDVAMYFCIGVLIAAFFKTRVVFREDLQDSMYALAQNGMVSPIILMALAFVLSLCSTTDAFLIASDGLFPNAAKMAFLVFGPMMDVKLIFLYTTVLQKKAVILLFLGLAVLTYVFCQQSAPFLNSLK